MPAARGVALLCNLSIMHRQSCRVATWTSGKQLESSSRSSLPTLALIYLRYSRSSVPGGGGSIEVILATKSNNGPRGTVTGDFVGHRKRAARIPRRPVSRSAPLCRPVHNGRSSGESLPPWGSPSYETFPGTYPDVDSHDSWTARLDRTTEKRETQKKTSIALALSSALPFLG